MFQSLQKGVRGIGLHGGVCGKKNVGHDLEGFDVGAETRWDSVTCWFNHIVASFIDAQAASHERHLSESPDGTQLSHGIDKNYAGSIRLGHM